MFPSLSKSIAEFIKGEDGDTGVEYAILLSLIIIVCVAAVTTMGKNAKTTFTAVSASLGGT